MRRPALLFACLTALAGLAACDRAPRGDAAAARPAGPAAPAQSVATPAGAMRVGVVASGLEHPWAVAPLPDVT